MPPREQGQLISLTRSRSERALCADRQRRKKAPPAPRAGGSIAIETAARLQTLVACESVGTKGIPQ
jgi:hypothetical protein